MCGASGNGPGRFKRERAVVGARRGSRASNAGYRVSIGVHPWPPSIVVHRLCGMAISRVLAV